MTAIDTSKLVCPPMRDASPREWHLYRRFQEEQSRADSLAKCFGSVKRMSKFQTIAQWASSALMLWQAILIRTVDQTALNKALGSIFTWMGF
jgi:hypothetical protein